MAVDGCPHSFRELVDTVLPRHMAALRVSMAQPVQMAEFAVAGRGAVSVAQRHGFSGHFPGAYVLMEDGRPIYVGISRHVFERLHQHVRPGDHLTATLAYRMARRDMPMAGRAKELMAHPDFRATFDARRQYLLGLTAGVVEIRNALEMYVFEAFCALELDTGFPDGWNTFVTH